MPSLILTIAKTTFLESVRQPIYFILIAMAGLMQIFNTAATGYSLGYTESGEVSGDNKLLLDLGLATVFFCGTLLAAFIATAAVSREIEKKTVLTVVSKPVPRPVVVVGKFVGIAAAMLIATITMIAFLQLAIRHGVLSTARDEVDTVVVGFGFAAVLISIGVATWCNFFYGWSFTQTASLLLCPLMIAAWVFVLLINKKWEWQSPVRDFHPQIVIASTALVLALLVLSAIATAASTRLGQVMTLVVCFGAFVLGLLSNHLLGRHAYHNEVVGQILTAKPERDQHQSFTGMGDTYFVTLKSASNRAVRPGDPFYYGPNPNGFDMPVPEFESFAERGGKADDENTYFKPGSPGSLIVTEAAPRVITVRNVGATPVQVSRPPQKDDSIFTHRTDLNPLALGAWGVVPNMQFFWLSDAVTQNRPVPWSHLLRIGAYSACQITAFLSLAVILFQKREVG